MRITNYNLETNKKIGNFKIALFSDVHYSGKGFSIRKLNQIVQVIAFNKPNYICIPGDFIDSTLAVKNAIDRTNLLSFFKKLGTIAPVIISLGNHDIQDNPKANCNYKTIPDFISAINQIENVYLLDNESKEYPGICFYGLTYGYLNYTESKKDFETVETKTLSKPIKFSETNYNIILSHSPLIFKNKNIFNDLNNTDLVLSGHMHNGAIPIAFDKIIKGHRGIIAPNKKLFPTYTRGHIKLNDNKSDLIISKGITTISKDALSFFKILRPIYPMNIEFINVVRKDEKTR